MREIAKPMFLEPFCLCGLLGPLARGLGVGIYKIAKCNPLIRISESDPYRILLHKVSTMVGVDDMRDRPRSQG